jgi:hypothetical protein
MIDDIVPEAPVPAPPPTLKKRSKTGKIIGIGCGGLIALIVVVTVIRAIIDPEGFKSSMKSAETKQTTEQKVEPEPTPKPEPEPTSKPELKKPLTIGISREKIMDLFATVNFEKGKPIDGLENYIGTSGNNCIIQLIGPEDALVRASITGGFGGADGGQGKETIEEMIIFVSLNDFGQRPWIIESLQGIISGNTEKATKIVGSKRYTISAAKIGDVEMVTIGVEPK